MPWSTTLTTIWRIAPAQPHGARAADDEPRLARREDDGGRHHARQPVAGPECGAGGIQVLLAEHVVQVDARPRDDEARAAAGRGRERGRVPGGVDDADVRGRGSPRGLGRRSTTAPGHARPPSRLRSARGGGSAAPPRYRPLRTGPPRALEASRMTSASAAIPSALPARGIGPRRSSSRSAKAMRRPPADGGGFDTNSHAAVGRADGPPADDAVGGRSCSVIRRLPRERPRSARRRARRGRRRRRPRPRATRACPRGRSSRAGLRRRGRVRPRRCAGLRGRSGAPRRGSRAGTPARRSARRPRGRPRPPARAARAREPCVAPVRLGQARDGAGHGARGGADPEELGRARVERDLDAHHLAARLRPASPRPGTATKKSSRQSLPSRARCTSMKPPPPGPGQRALGHPGDGGGRDARVHGVAAFLEDPRPRLSGQRVAGGDGALHGAEGSAVAWRGESTRA